MNLLQIPRFARDDAFALVAEASGLRATAGGRGH
jgi:hypothetical protein